MKKIIVLSSLLVLLLIFGCWTGSKALRSSRAQGYQPGVAVQSLCQDSGTLKAKPTKSPGANYQTAG